MNKNFLRSCFLTGLLVLVSGAAVAQYGNEWINFGQEYYKVTLASNGAFRLTYSDLQSAGFPVASVDPRRVKLFYRGVEQAIILQGQADASFDPGDYIEFYGKKNDGTNDTQLYRSPGLQPHPYYNLYNDTSAYFLTWSLGAVQGKRMATFSQVNVPPIPKDDFHYNQKLDVYFNEYSTGNTVSSALQYTQFDEGEGWTGSTICIGNTGCTGQLDYTISGVGDGFSAGGDPQLDMLLVGRDALSHLAEIYVGPNSGSLRLLTTRSFSNYQTSSISLPLNWTDISVGGQLVVRVKALGVAGARDRLSVSYIKVTHPQTFNMASQVAKSFTLQANVSDKSYIEISNPPSNLTLWDITDPNNAVIIGLNPAGPHQSAVVPNTATSRLLFAKNNFATPVIKKISFRQIFPAVPNYLIVSHRSLMKPALGYSDPVKAYGGYRSSPEGGAYDTLVVPIDQLYNQFNFGETSPSAIYKFVKFMIENGDPKYLFLIGKGLNVNQGNFRKTVFGPNDFRDLVPSAGMPGSDMAFSAGLDGTTHEPALATGRITASTPTHVAAYLNKIIELESQGYTDLWRKEVLHLSGGIEPFELTTFKQYMSSFGDIAEGPYYGGNVTTIAKQEPNPVELINVSEEVNDGVNFITFFGHSSPNTIDIDIGFATDPVLGYNNPGKYPAFLINGCNAGVVFANSTVFGEDWILAANKGARNFIAHSSFGFVSTLRAYTQFFYEVGYGDSTYIRTGIGDIQKEVGRRYLEVNSADISSITQVQQMLLLGDPAVKLFGALKPDYEISDNALFLESFDGSPVTALSDSFAVKIISKNYGSVSKASLDVRIERTFNNGASVTYDSVFNSTGNLDTLTFTLRREEGVSGFGNNTFVVTLDYDNRIEELNEENNSGELNLFIPLSGTKNLFPLDYGIVSETSINLTWQNTDLLTEEREYLIELDTIPSFDSPYLKSETITGDVLLQYPVTLLATDSLAYYWRTRLKQPQTGENKTWSLTTFSYIENSDDGWAQVHFPQFENNVTVGLVKYDALKKLTFEETSATVFVNNFGSNHPAPATTSFKVNDVEYNLATQGQPCRNNTINFVAFDKTTLVPYAGIPFIFQDPRTCGREPQVINSFRLSEMETGLNDDVLQYIDNIGASDSVVVFSIGNANVTSWSANVISKLEELGIGSGQIASLQLGEPVVIFGKKGASPGTATIHATTDTPENEQELQVGETLTGKYVSGNMNSTIIGPAQSWQVFKVFTREKEPDDDYSFDIVGLNLAGEETTIHSGITGSADLSSLDAADFPYIKIVVNTSDEVNQTPIQIRHWIVHYTPVPEGLLLFLGSREKVTIQEGDSWQADYAFLNISGKTFNDSLHVDFENFNQPSRTSEKQTLEIKAPSPGDSVQFSFRVESLTKVGANDINVFVNPKILPEQYYENNVLELREHLNVEGDGTIPVLEVTIDGRYVQNGDFVSSNPFILAKVQDENRFLLKTDTTGVRILLKSPCETGDCPFNSIYFSRPDVAWFPANEESDFSVEFRPEQLHEGEYTLRIEAQDGSGNKTLLPYEVQFVVDIESAVEFLMPFPNPSSSSVYFNFILKGSILPSFVSLQIYSLDGREVHSYLISGESLHIGTNQVEWDGRDERGVLRDQGLYIYRVTVGQEGGNAVNRGKIMLVR